MLKSLIEPLQKRILAKNLCVACTRSLDKSKKREPMTLKSDLVLCHCGRAYIYDREHKKYRRAIDAEVRSIPGIVTRA